MTKQPRELVLLSKARRLIAEAATVHEIKDIRDKAQSIRGYAKNKPVAR